MTPEKASLEGRVALVTGAAVGIGNSIAQCFANFSGAVVVADINGEGAMAFAAELRDQGHRALGVECDVRVQKDVDRLFDETLREFDRLDILVNNAGAAPAGGKLFHTQTEDDWREALDINLLQVYRCTSAAVRSMIDREIEGSIIHMTTIEAFRGAPGYAHFSAAKAAVVNFTMSLALELAPWGIRVNSIAPDATLTPKRWDIETQIQREGVPRHIARGRRGRADDFGGAALYLASDLSEWVTGEVIHVGGGTRAASGWVRDEEGYWNCGALPHVYSGKPHPRYPVPELPTR